MESNNSHASAVAAWSRLWKKTQHSTTVNPPLINNRLQTPTDTNQALLPSSPTSSLVKINRTLPKKLRRSKHHRHPPAVQPSSNPISFNNGINEEFGDVISRKPDRILRIWLQNINRLPALRNSVKSKKLISTIAHKQIDIALMTEVGLCWKLVHNSDQWHERTREAFQTTRSSFAYNTNELNMTSTVQFGGVGIMATDDAAHRVIAQGHDPTGLGRWTWLRLAGKQHHFLRVVAAYRPVPSYTHGPSTVHAQHERYLFENHRDEDPRTAFYNDLKISINEWKAQGDLVIVGIDANEDVRNGDTSRTFSELDMREVILNAHPLQQPPATCDKNMKDEPIDGLFATSGLQIVAGGYSSFNSGCPSDHRYLWIDVPYSDAFGYSSPPLVPPSARRLQTKNPKSVEHYNSRVRLALEAEGLFLALRDLTTTAAAKGWSDPLEAEYNRINSRQVVIRKEVERKIRHLRMGAIPWSPQLQRFRTAIEIWTLLLRKRKGTRNISNRKLRRLLASTDITDAYQRTIPEIEDSLNQAFVDYKKAREQALPWRDEFLITLAENRAFAKGTDKDTELQQMRKIEQQRRIARNIKRMQGKLVRNATIQIVVNDHEGRRVVTDKTEMENACIHENISRFSQSHDTPPMVEPLVDDLGFLADTTEAQSILDGTYQAPPGLSHYAALLLRELRMPDNVRLHPMSAVTVTPTTNRAAWKRQKEAVSSEPDGLTYSHYKAASLDDIINDFDASIRSLPYEYGFSPQNWQSITDVEILKKAGVYDIDKMRTITLMDAAYNMNNKQLGRDVLQHAESLHNLAREQYGSRKHHQACTAATNKVLTMDLLRIRRQAGALCSNDAKACYDRVVHSIAALSFLRQGAPRSAVLSLLKTLQKARHKIRTGFGISKSTYGGNLSPPIQGLGQGNGAAPTGWALISTPLINMMRTAGFGLQFCMCLSSILIAFLCYAFVDDTDLIHTGKSVLTPGHEIVGDMQRFVNHWEGGLRATGGALRVDKSCWYLIDFVWRNNSWHYASKRDVPGDITVRDADGQVKPLPRLEPHEANETLGIFLTMDGDQQAEVQHLRSKTSAFAEHLRTGMIQRDEAWHALHSTILKTLEYPMDAINLTKKQWDYVMAPLLRVVLPRSGIARTFPRDLLYAPPTLTGMGIVHPFYKQNLKHLDLVLRETLTNSITSDLIRAILEQHRLEIGILCTNGNWNLKVFGPCLTSSWFSDLILFCEKEDIFLVDTSPTLPLHAANDVYLMQSFADAGYRNHDLIVLNQCRMYLKVISLADLVTADGVSITQDAYNGKRNRVRDLGWPRLPPSLPRTSWNLWRRAIDRCFLHPHSSHRQLRRPLGEWLPVARPSWLWFFSPGECRLYHSEGPLFRVFVRVSRGRTRTVNGRFSAIPTVSYSLPNDYQLATVSRYTGDIFQLTGVARIPPSAPPPSVCYHTSGLLDILDTMDPLDRWAVDGLVSDDEGFTLAQGIISGQATAVSDGSYKDYIGTSGFVLRGRQRQIGAVGDNVVPGNPQEQSSYRSELAGISGILAIINAVCKKFDIQAGSVLIALDGEQALLQASSTRPLSPQATDFDLLSDIRAKIRKLPITLQWQWIAGHQDRHTSFHELSCLAQDNVSADNIAKQRLNDCFRAGYRPTSQRFGDEGWSVILQGVKVSKLDHRHIYDTLWAVPGISYWSRKHSVPLMTLATVDWDSCGDALRSLSFARRRRLVKHASGHCGVGTTLKKWGLQDDTDCPRCGKEEDTIHVLRCRDPRALTVWETTLTHLDSWLLRKHTDPVIRRTILSRLREWHDGTPFSPIPWDCSFSSAITAQDAIGWYPFLLGQVSHHWKEAQQAYYTTLARDNTGKQWVKKLIIQLFNISWDLWEHRNGIKHSTLNPLKRREVQLYNDRITLEFATGDRCLLPRDKRWLRGSLGNLLRKLTPEQKQQWLTSVANARLRWQRRRALHASTQAASRRFFRRWLHTLEPSPPEVLP
jgi:hypothetical protein